MSNDLIPQVEAVRRSVGLLEDFPRTFLSVRGADRVKFLHNLVTHDIKGLLAGQGASSALLDRQGKIRFFFLVHAGPEELILETDPAHGPSLYQGLEQFHLSEEVRIEITNRYRVLCLHGPSASTLLGHAFPSMALPTASLSHWEGTVALGIQRIVRWDLFHVPGFELWVDPEKEATLWDLLLERGEPMGIERISPEAFEILRIEAGVPWPGKEITESVILNELGMEEMVSFTKGCYVGQEIVARIKYRAHPPRLLKGFLLTGKEVPSTGSSLIVEGKTVGVVTSVCFSPTLQRVIALGFLNFGAATTELGIQTASGLLPATVADLPFVPSSPSTSPSPPKGEKEGMRGEGKG